MKASINVYMMYSKPARAILQISRVGFLSTYLSTWLCILLIRLLINIGTGDPNACQSIQLDSNLFLYNVHHLKNVQKYQVDLLCFW
jgi:hypothetical protein